MRLDQLEVRRCLFCGAILRRPPHCCDSAIESWPDDEEDEEDEDFDEDGDEDDDFREDEDEDDEDFDDEDDG